jgi:predicted ATPase
MKITIENFGPIKHFVFDTEKDLTLIFGKNSVGKSYAISVVYVILKILSSLSNDTKITDDTLDLFKFTLTFPSIAKNATTETQTVTDKLLSYIYIHSVTNPLNNAIKNTFDNLKNITNQFSTEPLKFTIEKKNLCSILSLDEKQENITLNNFKTNDFFRSIILDIFNQNETRDIGNIYYLPASRSGLYQNVSSMGELFAELSQNRNFISKRVEVNSFSKPVSDYLLELFGIKEKNINPDFLDYIEEIEHDILQGKVEFNQQTKKIYFIPNNTTLELDLLATSSMVAEIAPIVCYLKYILTINYLKETKQVPILFIEEPEAHLHPETQVKLMRVFARLVKDNKIKLVMTSHSNYIFNAASNLVMDKKIDQDKFSAVLFKMTEEGSIAQDMATDDYGIDDDNFIDVAESLYEEKIEIINKLNG